MITRVKTIGAGKTRVRGDGPRGRRPPAREEESRGVPPAPAREDRARVKTNRAEESPRVETLIRAWTAQLKEGRADGADNSLPFLPS
jgi:hypothetical protein